MTVWGSGQPRRVGVVGSGYVGTVVAAGLAHVGHQVLVVEADPDRLTSLRAGRAPFHEPGLDQLICSGTEHGRLDFSCDLGELMARCDLVFLCIGTPSGDNGGPDTTAIAAIARQIATQVEPRHILINKSTVPVGSGRWVASIIEQAEEPRLHQQPRVASNPEFLREGQAVEDFLHPDRLVLGSEDPSVLDELIALYAPIINQSFDGCPPGPTTVPVIRTGLATAELSKYASNAFLATKVSFANEMARLCETVGADVDEVTSIMGLDPRIGPQFLGAGIGWGGSCLGKDVSALIATSEEHGHPAWLLRAAVEVNEAQRHLVADHLQAALTSLTGARVALFGLSFKAGTDDLRDSPALTVARDLIERGATVSAFDPVVSDVPDLPELAVAAGAYKAAFGADAVVVATDWPQFSKLDLRRLKSVMRGDIIFDGRNVFDPQAAEAAGLVYCGVGRPRVASGPMTPFATPQASTGAVRSVLASSPLPSPDRTMSSSNPFAPVVCFGERIRTLRRIGAGLTPRLVGGPSSRRLPRPQ